MTGSCRRACVAVLCIVADNRIAKIGRSGQVRLPRGAEVIRGEGEFVIAVLWNMHVHPGPGDRTANLRLLIANGVTGIRIMDGAPEHRRWRKEIEAGRMLGKPRMMQRAGLGILAGTDDGNPYTFIGLGLHDELGELVAAGLTPMQALQAATRNPARFLGRLAVQGSIRKARLLI